MNNNNKVGISETLNNLVELSKSMTHDGPALAFLGWVGLGVTTGRGSKTLSKIFSLASNHQFTHFDFTSGGVIPGKIPHHSHMCTGEFTKTGVTLTVFLYQEYPG